MNAANPALPEPSSTVLSIEYAEELNGDDVSLREPVDRTASRRPNASSKALAFNHPISFLASAGACALMKSLYATNALVKFCTSVGVIVRSELASALLGSAEAPEPSPSSSKPGKKPCCFSAAVSKLACSFSAVASNTLRSAVNVLCAVSTAVCLSII